MLVRLTVLLRTAFVALPSPGLQLAKMARKHLSALEAAMMGPPIKQLTVIADLGEDEWNGIDSAQPSVQIGMTVELEARVWPAPLPRYHHLMRLVCRV